MLSLDRNVPGNQPPVANAGAAQQVRIGSTVQIDGRGSYDPEGEAITPTWQFLSIPAGSGAALVGPDTLTPTFVADAEGVYRARLDVVEPLGALASAMVTITASANRPPVAVIAPVPAITRVPAEPPFGRPYWYQCGSKEITQRATARLGERIGSLVDVFRPEAGTATWLYYPEVSIPNGATYWAGTIRQGCNLGRWQLTQTGAVSHFGVVKGYSVWVYGTGAGFEVHARCVRDPSYRPIVIGRSLYSDEFVNQVVLQADLRRVTVNSVSFTRGARTQVIPLAFTCPLP